MYIRTGLPSLENYEYTYVGPGVYMAIAATQLDVEIKKHLCYS